MEAVLGTDYYEKFFASFKSRVRLAQTRAALAVNAELVGLYWELGVQLRQRDVENAWGTKVVERLAADLQREFPDIKGFSLRNLKYMKALSELWPGSQIVPQPVALLPWGHIRLLLDKTRDATTFLWYAEKALEAGWSRNVLGFQIESRLHERQGKAPTNFHQTLPLPLSDLAQETLKDPYCFDFLTQGDTASERSAEKALVNHIQKFLVELGTGFAFVGKQYHLEVSGQDFYLDLLFYHLTLRCFVIVELKSGEFKPEYAGKLNFYLSAVDAMLKKDTDNPSIGLILCREKDRLIAEWALKDMAKPMGIAEWKIQEMLPEELKGKLPSIEEFEKELTTETLKPI